VQSVPEVMLSNSAIELVCRALGCKPQDATITPVTGDASTRNYFRVRSTDASMIVAVYAAPFDERVSAIERLAALEASDPAARLTFANDPCAHIETTLLFLEAGLPVPKLLGSSGPDGVILLEDVGDIRLQDWLAGNSSSDAINAYRRALEIIVRIQEATELVCARPSICSALWFDEAKLRWELGFFFANYFNRYLHLKLKPATSSAVQADFKSLCSDLAARPRVLVHRDYHARNLMMHGGGMFIIDFQDARMGPASYDVASLLSDPYSTLARGRANELAEEFIAMKAGSKMPLLDVEAFREELQLMTVQRMLKAIGTYASQAVAGRDIYLPYIGPAIERALSAMKLLGRFESTCALLEEHGSPSSVLTA